MDFYSYLFTIHEQISTCEISMNDLRVMKMLQSIADVPSYSYKSNNDEYYCERVLVCVAV